MIDIAIRKTDQPKPRPWGKELGFGQYFSDHMFLIDWDGREWHSPRIVPYGPLPLDPAASVLQYAQTVFEGLKALRGQDGKVRLFRPDRHAARLRQSTQRLCMPELPTELLLDAVTQLVRLESDWVPTAPNSALYLRPTMIGTEGFLGVRPSRTYTFYIIASPVGSYYEGGFKPVNIWVEEACVRAAPGGLGAAKTGANYAASLFAAEQAKKYGYAQVLWLDAAEHKYLEEVGTMNLFVQIGDAFITPPIEGSILDGVTRNSILTLLREWGHEVVERPVSIDEIRSAFSEGCLKEVFGCGTGAVIAPVGELRYREHRMVIHDHQPGPVAVRLFDELTGIQRGAIADRHGWLFPV